MGNRKMSEWGNSNMTRTCQTFLFERRGRVIKRTAHRAQFKNNEVG